MTLSSEELDQFNSDGFIVLRDFLDSNSCDLIYEKAKYHLDNQIEPFELESEYHLSSKNTRQHDIDYNSKTNNSGIRRLRQVYNREIVFKNWMENYKIRPILQQILNDQVVITTSHHNSIMTKLPNIGTATRWHQDRRYWHYSDDNLVSIWLALGTECCDNGVLEFIPNSHKITFKKEQFDDKDYLIENSENKELIETKVSTNLCKGDIVIFHSLLLHRANMNITNNPKISFVYTVKGSKTIAKKDSRSSSFPEIILDTI